MRRKSRQPPQWNLNKVKDDLCEIEGDGGHVAAYITNEGVIMVDDTYEQDCERITSKIQGVTSQPIRYILSTDSPRRSQRRQRQVSLRQRDHIDAERAADHSPARATFTQATDVFLAGKHVQARDDGRGHTNGDAVVYFPDLRVVHTGDLTTANRPLIDYPGGGSIVEWPKTLDEVRKLDFDTVIPGYGPVSKRADLVTYRNNAEKMRNLVQGLIRQGKTQDDIAKVTTAEHREWTSGSL